MNYKHGLAHSRIDSIYKSMMARCYNPKCNRYKIYGGRGIKVCDEWLNDRTEFYKWAFDNGYDSSLPRGVQTIERVNVDGDYSPENCTFVDYVAQANNRRNNRTLTYNGKTHTIAEWAKIVGIRDKTIYTRISRGWDADKALTTPLKGN